MVAGEVSRVSAPMTPLEFINNAQTRLKDYIPGLLLCIEKVPGDIAEFGVYEGWLCRGIAELAPTRTVWAFDTFEGMPIEDHTVGLDDDNPPGKWASDRIQTLSRLAIPNIRVMKGRFVDTLPKCDSDGFALVHIDCDTYNGYRQVLNWLPTHLSNGAIVTLDDWDICTGALKAVNEWKPLWKDNAAWVGEMMFEWRKDTR